MAFTRHGDGAEAVRLDLADGSLAPLLPTRGTSHALAADPHSGLVVLAADDGSDGDGLGLAYHHLRTGRTEFPVALSAIEGAVLPLAVAPGGGRVALQVRRGARTHLLRHRVADGRLTEVDIPAGIIGGVGAWSATGLRFPYSSPVCPGAIATVGTSFQLAGLDAAPRVPAHLEWFTARTGDIEAVVYGDWRTAERVVVALHGGPDAAWDMGCQTTLQRLAAIGLRRRRPQPARQHRLRGRARRRDPRRLGRCPTASTSAASGATLHRGRPAHAQAPLLFGESYGAYLALLAAGHRPDLWSGCAAIAPFLSGAPALRGGVADRARPRRPARRPRRPRRARGRPAHHRPAARRPR